MCADAPDMGLAPGGRMRQEIYNDTFTHRRLGDRYHQPLFCAPLQFAGLAGNHRVTSAASRADIRSSTPAAGLPWFEYYDDSATAVGGAPALAKMKSVAELSAEKGDVALPENESVTPENLVVYRKGLKQGQVREGAF